MFFNGFFIVFLTLIIGNLNFCDSFEFERSPFSVNPGPLVKASKGGIWPKPQEQTTNASFYIIRPSAFQFKVTDQTCEILEDAIERYKQDLKSHEKIRRMAKVFYRKETRRQTLMQDKNFNGNLVELLVTLSKECEDKPHLNMDEQYELIVNDGKAVLSSSSVWGILRGLETWSQLIYISSDLGALLVNTSEIFDYPRFSHRGLLIDTSRHFLPMRIIYKMLDAMVMSKMNVLHWHIVDDQSFPFQSITFPELSAKGAYSSYHVYTPQNVQDVIKYATKRGIRVMPEFDTPGHTRSWGQAYPKLLSECFDSEGPDGSLGPMNPIAPETYEFMKKFLKEISEIFPDSYIHLGGDEVDFQCWNSNPEIRDYMARTGYTPKKLEELFVKEIMEIATNLSANYIVWQEVFDDGADLYPDTVVQVWKADNYRLELRNVTSKGYKALLSSCWYLDGLSSGGDWHKFYRCDPNDFLANPNQKKLVIGGEACMWGEVVDVNNVLARVWPRACAAAEKLWSNNDDLNISEAARRLEEHVCRMNRRKIPAQPPNGPGFCPGLNYT